MSNTILRCKNLCKKFGSKQVLDKVSFEIEEGDILAFIGPNGSGKTTTIKCMLGLNTIDSGDVLINGYSIKNDFKNAIGRVGAIVENPDFYMQLSGYDNLKLFKNMYSNVTFDDINRVVSLVGLDKRIKDKVEKYSLGMRQRLGIAQALLHSPNLLILDEPTNGLDPEGIKDLRNLLKKIAKKEKVGIFISSHNLAELDNFCNKACIIQNGVIIESNTIDKIKSSLKQGNVVEYSFEVNDTSRLKDILKENVEVLDKNNFKVASTKVEIFKINKKLVEANIEVYEIKRPESSLEDAFLSRTGGNKIV